MVMKDHPFKALNINELTNVINKNKPIFLNTDINPECKNLIENLLIVDSNNRLEWEELYKNNWIYDINSKINELTMSDKLKKDIKMFIKKEDSFDYCFENSVSDIVSFDETNDPNKFDLKKLLIKNYIKI